MNRLPNTRPWGLAVAPPPSDQDVRSKQFGRRVVVPHTDMSLKVSTPGFVRSPVLTF